MDKQDLKKHVDAIIEKTFFRLSNAYQHKEGYTKTPITCPKKECRLVFPAYYKDKEKNGTRISEQELRFCFVEALNDYCDTKGLNLFYSIETPTIDKYSGFTKKEGCNPKPNSDGGRSAEFDLVIFDENLKRKCLIEFKANNADEHEHLKDFVKLNNSEEGGDDVLRYFIEVIKSYTEGDSTKRTVGSLKKKLEINNGAIFYCYALEGKSDRRSKGDVQGENISDKINK